MADITDQHDQGSPSALDEHAVGNGNSIAGENRGIKRQRPSTADDDDDDDDKPGRERRKIEIKFITDKSRRHITFSKRKAGIMKKVRLDCSHASPRKFAVAFRDTSLTFHLGI
jgi:pheromone receptor transcription factor